MQAVAAVEHVLRRDRLFVVVALAIVSAVAWAYLVRDARHMAAMSLEAQMHAAMGMADVRTWGLADWLGLFVMWTVMMAAMMLPSAAPVIILVAGVYRRRGTPQARTAAAVFGLGYLVSWTAFSFAASTLQLALHRTVVLTPEMRLGSTALSGLLLLAAGIYQWLPIKNACLTHCQSPLGFLSQHWREGTGGALAMGMRHGTFCVGCCWLLMMLLFVVGVMNLLWIAVLAVFVLVEKLVKGSATLSRAAGAAAAGWGVYVILAAARFGG